ncbi:hypothetical protein PV326_006360 [Microctonus aethiopoides]|nr:hypothetical protein PV326_006360 [Microctonus aethiopoides]
MIMSRKPFEELGHKQQKIRLNKFLENFESWRQNLNFLNMYAHAEIDKHRDDVGTPLGNEDILANNVALIAEDIQQNQENGLNEGSSIGEDIQQNIENMEEIINRDEELNESSSDNNYNVDEDDNEVRICEEINIEPEVEPDEHRGNYNDGDRNNDNIDHVNDHNDDELLYNGAEITVQQSMILILAVQLKHNVTQSCIADIIELINLYYPRNDIQRNSLYKFNKFLGAGETGITKYFYCTIICTRALETSLDICSTCPRNKPS